MKITRIKAWQVDLPLKEGRYNWSNDNFVEVFDSNVVAVETDAGITGEEEVEAPLSRITAALNRSWCRVSTSPCGLNKRW
jgi:hypothetical protein